MKKVLVLFVVFLLSTEAVPLKPLRSGDLISRLQAEKRAVCSGDDQYGCDGWAADGLCDNSLYQAFMQGSCSAACGLCTAPSPAPPSPVTVNEIECLKAHNTKRALHGVDAMTWDASLTSGAHDWALGLAQKSKDRGSAVLEHSTSTSYGENLYYSAESGNGVKTCADAVTAWYDEEEHYNYQSYDQSTGDIGHFTQVVWKASTQLGVGIAKVKFGGMTYTFVVARYSPPGNVVGQSNYDENVPALV